MSQLTTKKSQEKSLVIFAQNVCSPKQTFKKAFNILYILYLIIGLKISISTLNDQKAHIIYTHQGLKALSHSVTESWATPYSGLMPNRETLNFSILADFD